MIFRLAFLASWFSLLYERLWTRFWPAVTIAAFWAAAAFMNVVWMFGEKAHAALLVLTGCAMVWALARPVRLPRAREVERRMEQAAHLDHRPLEALRDNPAGKPDEDTRDLWKQHAARMAALKSRLKIPAPRPDTPRQDRFALRHAALLLLLIGFVQAGPDALPRLEKSLHPAVSLSLPRHHTAFDVWITPPDYTRRAPVFLAASQPGVAVAPAHVSVPAGSLLKVRVDGTRRRPRLRFAGKPVPFARATARSWILSLPVTEDGMLRLRLGVRDLGEWRINSVADEAPSIAILKTEEGPQATLKITYSVTDDYGISSLLGTVSPPEPLPPEQGGQVVSFDMTPPAPGAEESTFTIDLASHLRAGQEARLVLSAADGAGQEAVSAEFPFPLPERKFTHPLAIKLIATRKALMKTKTAEDRRALATTLSTAGQDPAAYNGDIVIFMAIGSAVRRLIYDGGLEATLSVQDLLWDTALKLEDGGLSVTARDLAAALDDLTRALADKDTPKEEIQKKLAEAQRLMKEWLQSLVTQLAKNMQESGDTPPIPPEIAEKFMQNLDLEDILRQMRQMAEGGTRQDMQKMAEFLKNAVRGMRPGKSGEVSPEQAEAMQALKDLQEVITRQQELMDKTDRLHAEEKAEEEAKEQDDLREKLGDIARRLDEGLDKVPENLADADQSMKQSQKSFAEEAPRDSVPHQKNAIEQMQKGMDSAVASLAQQMKQMILTLGVAPGGQSGGFGPGFDPLGRGNDGERGLGGDLNLPEGAERRRVQEIIEELRRRSNEYQRPKVERDYIDRLLDKVY